MLIKGDAIRDNPVQARKMHKVLNNEDTVKALVSSVFDAATPLVKWRVAHFPPGRDGAFQQAIDGLDWLLPVGQFNAAGEHDNTNDNTSTYQWNRLVISRNNEAERKGLSILAWQTDRWFPIINQCRTCVGQWVDENSTFSDASRSHNEYMDAAVLATFCPWQKLRELVPKILAVEQPGTELQATVKFRGWEADQVQVRRASEAPNARRCAVRPMLGGSASRVDSNLFESWMETASKATNKRLGADRRLNNDTRELYALALVELNATLFEATVQLTEPLLVWRGLARIPGGAANLSDDELTRRLSTQWSATTFKKGVAEANFMQGPVSEAMRVEIEAQPGAWAIPTTKLIPNEWLCFSTEGEILLPPSLKWTKSPNEDTVDLPRVRAYTTQWRNARYVRYTVEVDPNIGRPRSGPGSSAGPPAPPPPPP
jgi:hypothetical protein